jgi:phage FluMu protein Com
VVGRRAGPSVTDDRLGRQRRLSWLEIRCARCKTPSDVDLAAMKHPPTTFVHDLASRLRCRKCTKAGRRPPATLLQLAWPPRHPRNES